MWKFIVAFSFLLSIAPQTVAADLLCEKGGVLKLIRGKESCPKKYLKVDLASLGGVINVQGESGQTGPQGPQGVQGPKGDTGPIGPQGIQGVQGEAGINGRQGDAGATGPQGFAGPKGDTGAAGMQGVQGPQGEKGLKGDRGVDGLQGSQGPVGANGAAGAQGIQGPKGDKGDAGAFGATVLRCQLAEKSSYVMAPSGHQGSTYSETVDARCAAGSFMLNYDISLSDTLNNPLPKPDDVGIFGQYVNSTGGQYPLGITFTVTLKRTLAGFISNVYRADLYCCPLN